jgi:fucose 4-O-acetylase-like acetyltransferase
MFAASSGASLDRMTPTNPSTRYHALDSLRAVMMLLGVYIHVICAYSNIPDVWWYKDDARSVFADEHLLFIHVFRMPVFFVMAGFFGALLYERRGARGLAVNRAKRIALPFAIGLVTLFPILIGMWRYTKVWGGPGPFAVAFQYVLGGAYWRHIHPFHLWFLLYLIFLIGLALAVLPAARRLDRTDFGRRFQAMFRAQVESPWRVLYFAAPTFATLCLMEFGVLDTPHGFAPVPKILAAYGVFFGFGWLLYLHRDLLGLFRQHAWKQVGAAFVLGWLNLHLAGIQLRALPGRDLGAFFGTAATGAVIVWLMVFGSTGLFLRYLDREIPAMRYLSDSSYWIYLMHGPVVLWGHIMVAGYAWSAALKTLVVLAISVPILVASYHLLARPTWVGVLLNGRRYPRRRVEGRENALTPVLDATSVR